MPAVTATFHVSAQRRGPTALDRAHRAMSHGRQRGAVAVTECRTVAAENVRHLGPLAGHRSGPIRLGRDPAAGLTED